MNFQQDSFVEYMVKRNKSSRDMLSFAGAGFLGAIIIIIGVILMFMYRLPAVAFFCLVGAIFLVWYLCTRKNIEFEYALTNGFVSVDKIINKSSRKRLTAFECADVEEYGDYDEERERLLRKRFDERIFAASDWESHGAKYIITRSKKTGYTLITLDPSEKLEEAMRAFFSRQLRSELILKERNRK